jgi:DNA-binding transcriptional MerR regulator
MEQKHFRIGELAEKLNVEKFVIRFWEKEFNIQSHRSEGGQRFYNVKDYERFQRIKTLLYEEGFTIAGAKKVLQEQKGSSRKEASITPCEKTQFDEAVVQKSTFSPEFKEKITSIQAQLKKIKERL